MHSHEEGAEMRRSIQERYLDRFGKPDDPAMPSLAWFFWAGLKLAVVTLVFSVVLGVAKSGFFFF